MWFRNGCKNYVDTGVSFGFLRLTLPMFVVHTFLHVMMIIILFSFFSILSLFFFCHLHYFCYFLLLFQFFAVLLSFLCLSLWEQFYINLGLSLDSSSLFLLLLLLMTMLFLLFLLSSLLFPGINSVTSCCLFIYLQDYDNVEVSAGRVSTALLIALIT